MNGIDYSSLMSNTGLFSDVAFKGTITGINSQKQATAAKTTDSDKQTNADKDTYEHSESTQVKAGYDRPKSVASSSTSTDTTESTETTQYKTIDSDGIQEGVELSDAAKELLKELREKYGDTMEISVANWSTDEESDYYASLTSKDYSVLINPDLLEKMAADDSVREQYESVISSASQASDKLVEELGEDVVDSIQSFTITIDADGNTTYAVKILKEMAESSKANSKTLAEQQKERLEEKKEEEKAQEKKAQEEEQEEELQEELTEKLEAGSLDELIEMIKNRKVSA